MTHYLGITVTRKIAPFPGAEKIRGELAVKAQMEALGLECEVPEEILFLRRGKSKTHEPTKNVILPGYVFLNIPTERFFDTIGITGLSPTRMLITEQEMKAHVRPFIERAEKRAAEAQKVIDAGDRAAMCNFAPGDAIQALAGPFMDRALSFVRMAMTPDRPYPLVEVEAEVFGRKVPVRLDPMDVRAG